MSPVKLVTEQGQQGLIRRLRHLADGIEAGDFGAVDEATVVFPGANEIFHMGGPDTSSGSSALLNCACAVTKITTGVLDSGSFP